MVYAKSAQVLPGSSYWVLFMWEVLVGLLDAREPILVFVVWLSAVKGTFFWAW